MKRFALDSNVLVYLAGAQRFEADRLKVINSGDVVLELMQVAILVAPVQSMGEALRVLTKNFGRTGQDLDETISQWEINFEAVPTTLVMLSDAIGLAARHRLQHWDSVILSAAANANCDVLLSEDMQDGFIWRGLTVINPFAEHVHPLLASLLEP